MKELIKMIENKKKLSDLNSDEFAKLLKSEDFRDISFEIRMEIEKETFKRVTK